MQEPKLSRLTYTVIALLASMVLAIAYALIFGEPVPVVVELPEESVVVQPQISLEQPAADPGLAFDVDTTHYTNISASGSVTATDDLIAGDDLTVTDDSTLTDDVAVGGDLTVTGAGTVGGNLTVSGAVTVTQSGKDLEIGDDLTVLDDSTLTDDVDIGGTLNFGANDLNPLGYASDGYQAVFGTTAITGTATAAHGLTTVTFALCTLGRDPDDDAGDAAHCTLTVSSNTVTLKVWQDDFVTEATETDIDVHWLVIGQP